MLNISIISATELSKSTYADLIIVNDTLSPKETTAIIRAFNEHAQNPAQQWVHLVERRWPALLSGKKTSTLRWNEGFIHKGFLVYKSCPNEKFSEVVYVNRVYYLPLKNAIELEGFDERTPDMDTALQHMRIHYQDITLDTMIVYAEHLSVPETRLQYPTEVAKILGENK